MIRFEQVTFEYRRSNRSVRALDRVDLEVQPGECVAVLGANGSGKSTLVRLCNGLLTPSAGRVTVDGMDTRSAHQELRARVGVVIQNPDDQIVATTVEEDVAFGPENLGLNQDELRHRVDRALGAVGLEGFEHREPHLLSGGQKQRVAIAGVLAMGSRYLVFDEPTSMLDPVGRDEALRVIRDLPARGHGVLLVTHDLSEAVSADRVIVLERGAVAFSGTPAELLGDDRLQAWGFSVPGYLRFLQELRREGVAVDPSWDVDTVVEALCR